MKYKLGGAIQAFAILWLAVGNLSTFCFFMFVAPVETSVPEMIVRGLVSLAIVTVWTLACLWVFWTMD